MGARRRSSCDRRVIDTVDLSDFRCLTLYRLINQHNIDQTNICAFFDTKVRFNKRDANEGKTRCDRQDDLCDLNQGYPHAPSRCFRDDDRNLLVPVALLKLCNRPPVLGQVQEREREHARGPIYIRVLDA